MKWFVLIMIGCSTVWGLTIGQVPQAIVLKDALVSGGDWHSSRLKDKICVVFYVDPDEKNINDDFSKILKKSRLKLSVSVIVNMKSTWIPKFLITKGLKKEQEKEKDILFIMDNERTLIKKWGLKDDYSSILIFGDGGKLIYQFVGKMKKKEIDKVMSLVNIAFSK